MYNLYVTLLLLFKSEINARPKYKIVCLKKQA